MVVEIEDAGADIPNNVFVAVQREELPPPSGGGQTDYGKMG